MYQIQRLLSCVCFIACTAFHSYSQSHSSHIHIDQFGYRPEAQKIAVISDPQIGFNSSSSYTPGQVLNVRKYDNDSTVFSATITSWQSGQTHGQSGDRAWWFDFSALQDTGTYYVYDPTNNTSSYPFVIRENVYQHVLRQAVRTYYLQRCNIEKPAIFAGTGWQDTLSNFVGTEQDSDCRLVSNPNSSTSRDLTKGWFDAGDYNKYINSADQVVHDLLFAYQHQPGIWTDDYQIPESGNGIPDLLDELKWELDWMLSMQNPDGSVLHKISNLNFNAASPPSLDTEVRRYAPATISATISACASFAHAAIVYASLSQPSMQSYATLLQDAAEGAWAWLELNTGTSNYNNAGFVNAAMEDSPYHQSVNRAVAAVYLFALTGDIAFRNHFDNEWPNVHLNEWWFAYVFEMEIQDAALYYTTLSNTTTSVKDEILLRYSSSIQNSGDNLPAYNTQADPYLSHLATSDYTWGNNRDKSHKGTLYTNMYEFGLDTTNTDFYRDVAEGYVHYVHGVNPLNLTFLTNMGDLGAENSCNTFYHAWFHDGHPDWDEVGTSTYGPPPGFVTGGCNPSYAPDNAYNGPPIEPPQNQPILKSYLDWNTSWPQNSWEITENSIVYQSAYVRLLAQFVSIGESEINCKVVKSTADDGISSLREAISCASHGDTVWIDNILSGDTITITSAPIIIDRSVTIIGALEDQVVIDASQVDHLFTIQQNQIVHIQGMNAYSDSTRVIQNSGDLTLESCNFDCQADDCIRNDWILRIKSSVNIKDQ